MTALPVDLTLMRLRNLDRWATARLPAWAAARGDGAPLEPLRDTQGITVGLRGRAGPGVVTVTADSRSVTLTVTDPATGAPELILTATTPTPIRNTARF